MEEFVNFNGELLEKDGFSLGLSNRAFRFGDSIFETIRIFDGNIIFLENHYSRLIYSLGILRISIPEFFTEKYFETEILKLAEINKLNGNARIRFTVSRKSNGSIYFVDSKVGFDFVIEASSIDSNNFNDDIINYSIGIYDEIKKSNSLLSQIKTNNVLLHSIAGSVISEGSLNNILLINETNFISEAVNANIFLVKNNVFFTPKLSDGCVNGVMRNYIINLIQNHTSYKIIEKSIRVDELEYYDEVFLTNSIIGIQAVDILYEKQFIRDKSIEIKVLLKQYINSFLDQKES